RRHTRFSRDWSSDVCSSDWRSLPGRRWQAAGASQMLRRTWCRGHVSKVSPPSAPVGTAGAVCRMGHCTKGSNMQKARAGRTGTTRMPWHGWLLGGVLAIYGLAAGFDHFMSLAQGEAYYRGSGMSDMQVAYFSAQPPWAIAGWTVSVWAGLWGALAMLLRRRLASLLFALATGGSLVYIAYVLVLTNG